MKVTYMGVHHALPPKVQEKLDLKFAKLAKLLEKRGEREARVMLTQERHLHKAEITLNFYDHQLIGVGLDADLFTAMSIAIERLESQAVKHRTKFREKKRRNGPEKGGELELEANPGTRNSPVEAMDQEEAGPRIFHVNHHERRKPMTIEEAMLAMEDGRQYLVYRDAERDCVSVLIRRADGNFDLLEL